MLLLCNLIAPLNMKLKSVSVYGLFNCYDHSFELNDEGLTFIHSQNGVGKSTTLKLIYDLFKGDAEAVSEVPFDRMDLGFFDGTNVIIENHEGLFIQIQKNEMEEEVSIDEVKEMLNVIYLSPERNTVKKMDGRLVPAIEAYASELNDILVSAKSHRKLQPAPKSEIKPMEDDEFISWCKDLKARLDFIWDAGFELELPSNLRFPPSRYEYSESKEEYRELACSIENWVNTNYPLAESIVVFQDIVNGLFYNKDIYVSDKNQLCVVLEDKTDLPISRLSSGEKQIIIMFYRLLFHTTPGSLAIIDEPEISLHVSWQQKLGSIFLDISRIRNVEILVATHSPQIIHDKWDLAKELRAERA
jgi:ABC-type transport system involved in cytochrome c biogenesis ATPase subunit